MLSKKKKEQIDYSREVFGKSVIQVRHDTKSTLRKSQLSR